MKFRSILEIVNDRLQTILENRLDSVSVSGHLYLETEEGEIYLGRNRVTRTFRNFVAGILARPDTITVPPDGWNGSSKVVDRLGDEGISPANVYLPVYLGIGESTASPTGDEGNWGATPTDPINKGGVPCLFQLQNVHWNADPTDYGSAPIAVSFYFDIPELFDVTVGGSPTTSFQINEWALLSEDKKVLARKYAPFNKLPEFGVTLRWEIRT